MTRHGFLSSLLFSFLRLLTSHFPPFSGIFYGFVRYLYTYLFKNLSVLQVLGQILLIVSLILDVYLSLDWNCSNWSNSSWEVLWYGLGGTCEGIVYLGGG